MKVKFNLFDLVKRLEQHKGESVSQSFIAEKSNLSRYTIQKIIKNDSERVDLSTLAALLGFFHSEGMKSIGPGDLFRVESTESERDNE